MAKSEGNGPEYKTDDPLTLMAVLIDLTAPRSVKEAALRRIREIERKTGKTIYGGYNGH